MKFKEKFVKKYEKLTDFEEYKNSVENNFARKSVKINTLNYSVNSVRKSLEKDGWKLKKISWCKDGFFIEHKTGRRDIGNSDQHKKGMIFSMGAPSMIPAQYFNYGLRSNFLDMCAAPGGKTFNIACLIGKNGYLRANEPNGFRRNILKINMERCGVNKIKYDTQKGEDYLCSEKFDGILLDVPCTGSGLIKGKTTKTKKLLKEWNPKVIEKYARLQKKILKRAYSCLKKNGRIVYVTCSLEPEEDEKLVESFLKDHIDCKLVKPPRLNGYRIKSSLKNYIKIWPQYYDTPGLFVAVIEKN
jgi:16S rRNA C967 or C1407 C5-methylase (RsmB/RsmF family)